MKNIEHILSDEEKAIIENHFIHNKDSSKQNFIKFCQDIILKYTGNTFEFKNQKGEKDYSIELIWDKATHETAMMHCFAHPKYSHSNGKMKSFKIFNGDMNAVNKNKQTALMFLASSKNNLFSVKSIIKGDSEGFDINVLDGKNNSLHIYVLNSYEKDMFKNESNRWFSVLGKIEFIKEVLLDWVEADIPKGKKQKDFISNKGFELIEEMKVFRDQTLKTFDGKKQEFIEYVNEEIGQIERISRMVQLSTELTTQEPKKTIKKI